MPAPVPVRSVAAMATHATLPPPLLLSVSFFPGSRVMPDSQPLFSPFILGQIHYGNKEKRSRAPTRCHNPSSPVGEEKSRFEKQHKQMWKKKPNTESKQCCLMSARFNIRALAQCELHLYVPVITIMQEKNTVTSSSARQMSPLTLRGRKEIAAADFQLHSERFPFPCVVAGLSLDPVSGWMGERRRAPPTWRAGTSWRAI